jgi:hypothetical protein
MLKEVRGIKNTSVLTELRTLHSTITDVTAAGEFCEKTKPREEEREPATVHIPMAGNLTLPRGTRCFKTWIF